jgi:hypothetical protein
MVAMEPSQLEGMREGIGLPMFMARMPRYLRDFLTTGGWTATFIGPIHVCSTAVEHTCLRVHGLANPTPHLALRQSNPD